jgi:N-acetylglucosamine kinase-like BadF-type ATPase
MLEVKMSMIKDEMALDVESIVELISKLQPEERKLFQAVLSEVLDRGNDLSDVIINELAKKYADKARRLAGAGGE